MSRLIDGDVLMELYANRLELLAERYGVDSSECGVLAGAMKLLEAQPTIEERKTGKWTKAYDGNDDHVKCTGCFKTYDWTSQAQYFNFCPNCGVDMRGEEHDRQM